MIRRPRLIYRLHRELIPAIEQAHERLGQIVASLRQTGVPVYTVAVPENVTGWNATHWRDYFANQRARLLELKDAGAGPILDRLYPELFDATRDYFQDLQSIIGYINTALDRHRNADTTLRNETLTNGERSQLANAIEALLEA